MCILLRNLGSIPFAALKQSSIVRTAIVKMSSAASENESNGPIETAIREAIVDKLQPIHYEVVNESYMHNVPKGSETHFKVLVVSTKFESLPLIKVRNAFSFAGESNPFILFWFIPQRHRLVNEVVKQKLQGSFVHALSIEAKSPAQWNENYKLEPSPNCRGGFGK